MRSYALIRMQGGVPALPEDVTIQGYALGAASGDWGMYQVVGTSDQLAALAALDVDAAVGICTIASLPDVISAAVRNKIDAWSDANFPSLPAVPPSWTNEQMIRELYGRANAHYDHDKFYLHPGGIVVEPIAQTLVLARSVYEDVRYSPVAVKRLIVLGDFALWQVDDYHDRLIRLHNRLWDLPPIESLGMLGAVQTFGVSFFSWAVTNACDLSTSALVARRDRVADWLESLGYSDTTELRAATDEHEQIAGIVDALGYTMNQLWGAMIE